MSEGSQRWRAGSAGRIAARRAAEDHGLCTTCLGRGRWFRRPRGINSPVEMKTCPACGGSGEDCSSAFQLDGRGPGGVA